MTDTFICILKNTEIRLWGLSGRERISRMVSGYPDLQLIEAASQAPAAVRVLLLRADYLFEARVFQALLNLQEDTLVYTGDNEDVVAIMAKSADAPQLAAELLGKEKKSLISGLHRETVAQLISAYDPALLKYDPPTILPINRQTRERLEEELFHGSYKGITDFVTKWIWPVPARRAIKLCVKYNISANQVTVFSLILAVLAGLAFWYGSLALGLLLGWCMTFLDTVDGKLARVTLTSSKVGDWLDHGLDLIHPPLWYLAWGAGIHASLTAALSLMTLFWILLAAYIGGRLCEGVFELWLAPFRLFTWQPADAYNRLITARRNPNLVILSLSLVFGRADFGFYGVIIWHSISTFVLMVRVYMAYSLKLRSGELRSWLNDINPQRDGHRLEVRLFTRLSKLNAVNSL